MTCPVTYSVKYASALLSVGTGTLATFIKIVPGGCAIASVPSEESTIVCLSVFGNLSQIGLFLHIGVESHAWAGTKHTETKPRAT